MPHEGHVGTRAVYGDSRLATAPRTQGTFPNTGARDPLLPAIRPHVATLGWRGCVLEVGCGTGKLTEILAARHLNIDSGLNGDGQPTLTLHDLRHTFGSHLVRQGADVVTVSRQMGHARPSITLDVYSHEFASVQHQASVAAKLTDAFGGILSSAEM